MRQQWLEFCRIVDASWELPLAINATLLIPTVILITGVYLVEGVQFPAPYRTLDALKEPCLWLLGVLAIVTFAQLAHRTYLRYVRLRHRLIG